MDPEKSQKVPSFTVSGIVRLFKRNNFRVKIRFSQHAISDFCLFLKEKDRCFFMRLLKFVSPKPLLSFCQKRNVSRGLRLLKVFRTMRLTGDHRKYFQKKSKKNSIFCFQGFSLRKIVFSCCFQLCKNGFRDLRILSGFFGAVKLMKL